MSPQLAALLERTSPLGASDLFLAAGRPPILRENGELSEIDQRPLPQEIIEELFALCDTDPAEVRDRDIGLQIPGGLRFRANLHRRSGQPAAVLRHVRSQVPTMDTLGLPEQLLTRWLTRPSGFILVTGSTGSGKSTTIASCLEWINAQMTRHIVTIEDPIEYVFSDRRSFFTQREVGGDTDTFATGLRSALRQSPDVIFLGEIRDRTTATIALQAAETGQLVVSSMQSLSVRDTFARMTNLFAEADRAAVLDLLAYQLIGCICQQLIPGPRGLFLALEHMENVGATRQYIRDGEPDRLSDHLRGRQTAENTTFLSSLIQGCQQGRITPEVGMAASGNEIEFARSLRGIA
ncbi:type IV pilus twitching motility protein PilT [soil metagenome]